MIRAIVTSSSTLEIAGPRRITWRPASDPMFEQARRELEIGTERAIRAAEDAYIARHGDMHGVAFRVRSVIETLSGTVPLDVLSNGVTQQNES